MRVGVSCFLTDKSVDIAALARAAEERGFDEIWAPEHTHIPTGRETDWPMQDDAELPEMYRRSLDPFIALTAAAMVTERIRIGTSICLVSQHDPIVLAKTVATLDQISGGRLILGVGFGWNVDEMRHHGVDPDKRRTIGREKTLAMKELWTKEEASYSGDYVSFSPSWQWPKPLQQPHPPVWVGGGKSTMRHAAEWGDGWMPIEGVMPVAKLLHRMRNMVTDAGRDPDAFVTYLAGSPDDPAKIEEYRDAGLDGLSLGVSWDADWDTAQRELDANAAFRDQYLS